MRSMLLTFCLLVFGLSAHAEQSIVGYQAWKAARVDEARLNLERVHMSESSKAGEKKSESAKAKTQQAQLSLDVAQELTVNDYFLLYLRQFRSKDSLVEAAKRLTPEDTADLLISYQKHLAGSQQVDVIMPASAQLAPSTPTVSK